MGHDAPVNTATESVPSRFRDDDEDPAGRRSALGWVLYDFSNVVFATNLLSVYFPIWIVDDIGGKDSDYGIVNGLSMAAVFLVAPALGVLLDRIPRRKPLLIAATVLTCVCTLFIGFGGLRPALALFFVANAIFQTGVIVYDSMLPDVSRVGHRGRMSGRGVAAGFGGSVVGLLIGMSVLAFDDSAKPLVFKITALAFLVGSLPCFLWVKEPARAATQRLNRTAVLGSLADLKSTRGFLRANPRLRRFLLGRFVYTDAANTLLAFLGIYATKELGFSDFGVQLLLLSGILIGPFGAIAAGRWSDHIGPLITLRRTLFVWLAALSLAAAVPLAGLPEALFWLIAPLVGTAIGATAACDRPTLVQLAPVHEFGRAMGLYAMVGRFSAVTGPLLWAGVVSGLEFSRPIAVVGLAAMIVLSMAILRPLASSPLVHATQIDFGLSTDASVGAALPD